MQTAHPAYVRSAWWASAFLRYKRGTPNHRGKATLLRALLRHGVRKGKLLVREMQNHNLLAISPVEGNAPWSVGWTCFENGVWEPHVERALLRLVQPGDTVMDIGANLGYFSAVLSRAVGPGGRVWAFEPVPSTFAQLQLCQALNHFDRLSPFQLALGNENKTIEIHVDPSVAGSASVHSLSVNAKAIVVPVEIRRLDDLVESGVVTAPKFIKIDVEGHERDVFAGATKLLRQARPTIIFEYNAEAATAAGWTFPELADLLRSCADYQFYRVQDHGFSPLEAGDPVASGAGYTDLLATCRPEEAMP